MTTAIAKPTVPRRPRAPIQASMCMSCERALASVILSFEEDGVSFRVCSMCHQDVPGGVSIPIVVVEW